MRIANKCVAVQYSDSMVCRQCGTEWDVNDPSPPQCKPKARKTWQDYFMDMAVVVASRSKDPSTQVGCVIVSEDKVVVSTGYNGIPAGVDDKPERMERPAKYLWTSHAEENAVAQAARVGARLRGGAAYVTHMPCSRCARTLIQAGITTVYVGVGKTSMPMEEFDVASQMFREAGVLTIPTGV